jgi:DNA-binding LytR/AlgR family response regulator
MKHSYIIIDDDSESVLKTLAITARFQNLSFLASANSYDEGLNLILEHKPTIVFLEIDPLNKESNLSLLLINELHRYLKVIPKIIITTKNKELAFDAIKYEALDYLTKPIDVNELRKTILKFEKANDSNTSFKEESNNEQSAPTPVEENINRTTSVDIPSTHENSQEEVQTMVAPENSSEENALTNTLEEEAPLKSMLPKKEVAIEDKPLIICVKSYGDYRFIEAKDICYLQADNNSTDIHLFNGEMITAFKTLKHFENVLSSPFVRIHNSYIVNIEYVSRIHTGNSVCYIKNTTTKLPFSKSYKENVDTIINSITNGNYLEI